MNPPIPGASPKEPPFTLILLFIIAAMAIILVIFEAILQDRHITKETGAENSMAQYFHPTSEKVAVPKVKIAEDSFYWNGGKATLKCRATSEGVVC